MKTKSSSIPGFSRHALALKLGRDRGTIYRITQGIEPVGTDAKGNPLFDLGAIQAKLAHGADRSLRDQKLSEEIRKLKIRNDREEGRLIAREAVLAAITRCNAAISSMLEQVLVQEYPSVVTGLDQDGARVYGQRLADRIREFGKSLRKEWEI